MIFSDKNNEARQKINLCFKAEIFTPENRRFAILFPIRKINTFFNAPILYAIKKAAVKAAYEHEGPVYMRFGRLATPIINDNAEYKFEIGKGVTLREGTDVAIIATGLCVAESLAAAEKLAADGVNAKVINIHTIKPLDEELVVAAAKECGRVVTVEEHSVIGGLGAAVCETLSRKAPTPVKTIGIQDCFGESGPAVSLLKKYGLDAEGIYASVKDFL